jgi:uncharacterized protein (DUF433 family)
MKQPHDAEDPPPTATNAPSRYFAAFPLGPVGGAEAPAPASALLGELGHDLAPKDPLEGLIIARLIQAGAQVGALHAAAERTATWLRELTLAERVFWAALTALQRHRRPRRAPSDPDDPGGSRPLRGFGLGFASSRPRTLPMTAAPARSGPTALQAPAPALDPAAEPTRVEPPRLALWVASDAPDDAPGSAPEAEAGATSAPLVASPAAADDRPAPAACDDPPAPAACDDPPAPAASRNAPTAPPAAQTPPRDPPAPAAPAHASLDDPAASIAAPSVDPPAPAAMPSASRDEDRPDPAPGDFPATATPCLAPRDDPNSTPADPPVPAATDWRPHVVIDPDIAPDWPVLRGTRIHVEAIAAAIEDGWSDAVLLDHLPSLTPELLAAAKACEAEAMSGPWPGGVPTPQPRINDRLAKPPPDTS